MEKVDEVASPGPAVLSPAGPCRISVLIASLGRPSLICALRSVLTDAAVPLEVVLVLDDPDVAPDKLLAPLPLTQRSRVRVLQNERNLGLTRSLNRGIEHCQGEILARLDDDDRFAPRRLERVLETFDAHPEVDVVVSDTQVVAGERQYRLTVPRGHDHISRALQRRNVLVHSAFNVRLSTLKAVGGYNDAYRYAQDYELYLRLLRHGARFLALSEPLAERVEAEGTITINRRQHQALYSLAALCLHHATTWQGEGAQVRAVCAAFARFAAPQSLRRSVRWWRAISRRADG
ncbi:glycosyltransferase [Ferrimonas balearica]|uniref:glycosyltransferase n=1 Tax=Ferrimonas balearica TaxID=44012 RepID=UPI001C99C102|nr:glycosyltransferase [Ferrimonas balearica]MBY5994259.1 glycosyltransferase [Ferrimonas balearica]